MIVFSKVGISELSAIFYIPARAVSSALSMAGEKSESEILSNGASPKGVCHVLSRIMNGLSVRQLRLADGTISQHLC